VFDAFMNPDAAGELKQTAQQLTKHPVSFVINSHYHDDHIRETRFLFQVPLSSALNGQKMK
jgi:glyoxylase-like metal-dependent hydrolase (beta-lactamase superfamily II)